MKNTGLLILTYFSFKDGLIQAYTLPYLKLIHRVNPEIRIYLLTKEKSEMVLTDPEKSLAREALAEYNIEWIPKTYIPFGIKAMSSQISLLIELMAMVKKKSISTIHCWGTPPGVEGFLLSKLTHCPLVIDSFEPHAEAQVENGSWTKNSPGYRILWWFEKRMARHASTLIYTTRNMISYAKEKYGAYDEKEFVKPACVDLDLFSVSDLKNPLLLESLSLQGKIIALYAGKFGGIYYDIEVFRLFKQAHEFWGDEFRALILTPTPDEEIDQFCIDVGLAREIVISRFVKHSEIAKYMGLADFALTPVKPVPSKKCCTPIKDGEYWALGLPVIITKDISDDSEIISKHGIGVVMEDFSEQRIQLAIEQMNELLRKQTRLELYNKVRPIAEKYRNFQIAENIYTKVYP